jgi:type I restriction enzyme R subunit
MLRYPDQIGWEHVTPEETLQLRGGDTGVYFKEVLAAPLLRMNPGVVDVNRAADIIRQLNLLNPSIEGNGDALSWL